MVESCLDAGRVVGGKNLQCCRLDRLRDLVKVDTKGGEGGLGECDGRKVDSVAAVDSGGKDAVVNGCRERNSVSTCEPKARRRNAYA